MGSEVTMAVRSRTSVNRGAGSRINNGWGMPTQPACTRNQPIVVKFPVNAAFIGQKLDFDYHVL
jgi:hypothetical protein